MPDPIRILIVDDHDMLREGLSAFLKAYQDLLLVGEASNGVDAIRQCASLKPDVVLMDLIMPEMTGVEAIRAIHASQPEVRIIALSSFGEDALVKDALRGGACGFLIKNISASRLAEAIRAAHAGWPTFAPEVASMLIDAPLAVKKTPDDLTDREKEVLEWMVKGLTNAEIAVKLNISPFTVKNHVSSILNRLGVTSRTEAVSLALTSGIVHAD